MPNSIEVSNYTKNIMLKKQEERLLQQIREQSTHNPVLLEIQGGSGLGLSQGQRVALVCSDSAFHIYLLPTGGELEIPFSILSGIEISGPGKTESNLGLMGGGFGVEGALKGIATAVVINALTTRSTVKTSLRIASNEGELFMQTSEIEPDQLRLLLSPAFVTIESVRLHNNPINGSSISVSAELEKLVNLFKDGFLTETEFSLAKNQLLGIDQNKSSSILPNSPCQPDNLGARFNLSDKKNKPEIDWQKPISELFAEARAKNGQERIDFEMAIKNFIYEKPLKLSQIMKLSNEDKEYIKKLTK